MKTDRLMKTHRTSRVSTDLLSASHITIHPCQNLNPDTLLPLPPDRTSPNGVPSTRLSSCPRLDLSEIPLLQVAAAAKSLQSCPTLCDPIDGSPPGSSIPGILQARTLEWVAISFSRGSSQCRDQTSVSCTSQWIL